MRLRDGLSISETARRSSLSRNTTKTWLREPIRREMQYARPGGPRKLDAQTSLVLDPASHPGVAAQNLGDWPSRDRTPIL
jgi:transposase